MKKLLFALTLASFIIALPAFALTADQCKDKRVKKLRSDKFFCEVTKIIENDPLYVPFLLTVAPTFTSVSITLLVVDASEQTDDKREIIMMNGSNGALQYLANGEMTEDFKLASAYLLLEKNANGVNLGNEDISGLNIANEIIEIANSY